MEARIRNFSAQNEKPIQTSPFFLDQVEEASATENTDAPAEGASDEAKE